MEWTRQPVSSTFRDAPAARQDSTFRAAGRGKQGATTGTRGGPFLTLQRSSQLFWLTLSFRLVNLNLVPLRADGRDWATRLLPQRDFSCAGSLLQSPYIRSQEVFDD